MRHCAGLHKRFDVATVGDNIGVLVSNLELTEVAAGDVLTSAGGRTI
jgi:hypothetical protein